MATGPYATINFEDLSCRANGSASLPFIIFLTQADGTMAAERFFGQKPRSMFTAILESVELAPAPLNPPRKA